MDVERYQDMLVHGTLPLIVDGESGRLRFARLGLDAPDDCISQPDQLPDGAITIHVFDDTSSQVGWIAAARRFAGNNVEIVETGSHLSNVVLEIDHSGQRPLARTLSEAIGYEHLGSRQEETSKRFDWVRKETMKRNLEAIDRDAWKNAWAAELKALSDMGHHLGHRSTSSVSPSDPIHFQIGPMFGSRVSDYALHRDGQGYRLSWGKFEPKVDRDLAERLGQVIDEHSVIWDDDAYSLRSEAFDEGAIARAETARNRIYDEHNQVRSIQSCRDHVRKAAANERLMGILKKARQGGPVVSGSLREPGIQINPRTGSAQATPAIHFSTGYKDGWMTAVYPGDRFDDDSIPRNAHAPMILVLSQAGKALVDGDEDLAASTFEAIAKINLAAGRGRGGPGIETSMVRDCMPWLDETAKDHLRRVIAPKLEKESSVQWLMSGRSNHNEGWAFVVAGMIAGIVEIGENRRPVLLETSTAPAPR